MERDLGWRHMDAGRRLERSLQVLALLRATVGQAHDTATDSLLLESVLTAAESIITYRRRYRSQAQLRDAPGPAARRRGQPALGRARARAAGRGPRRDAARRRRPAARGPAPPPARLDGAAALRDRGPRSPRPTTTAAATRSRRSSPGSPTGCCRPRTPSSASTSSTGCRSARCRRRDDLPRHPPDGVRVRGRRGREPQPAAPPAARRSGADVREHRDRLARRSRATTPSTPTSSATASATSPSTRPTARSTSPPPAWSRSTRASASRRCSATARGRRSATRSGATAARTRSTRCPSRWTRRSSRRPMRCAPTPSPSFPPGRGAARRRDSTSRRASTRTSPTSPARRRSATTLEEVLVGRKGVCQDFAHVGIGCLRSLGLPARYVSGYLETDPPPGRPKLVGADVSHAWFSVLVPEAGWLDVDPTNDQLVNQPLRRRSVRARLPRRAARSAASSTPRARAAR